MNKNLLDFMNGTKNVCICEVHLSRETNTNGWECIHVEIEGTQMYKFWHKPGVIKSDKPKHTGGKPSYAKVMTKQLENHPKLSLESSGFLFKMIDNINWSSNLLIKKQNKKPLIIDDFCEILHKSKPTIVKILKELKATNLLHHDKDGYRISDELLKKGGK